MSETTGERHCDRCQAVRMINLESQADRMDAWKSASKLLNEAEWPEEAKPTPGDVLTLAVFLSGEIGEAMTGND